MPKAATMTERMVAITAITEIHQRPAPDRQATLAPHHSIARAEAAKRITPIVPPYVQQVPHL